MRKIFVFVAVVIIVVANTNVWAAGVTASNVVCDPPGCVDVDDIATNAVETAKIADGAVTDAKIIGPISGSKLGVHTHNGSDIIDGTISTSKLSAGAVDTGAIADGAVSTAKISDGAVTDSKITGPISSSKISGVIGVEKLGIYAGTKIVHKGAADGVNTFNSVLQAIIAIGTTTDRYAIIVMPGYYEEDFASYFMDEVPGVIKNIDIIGQSREGTIIKAIGSPDMWRGLQFINMPSGMYLKNLTFEGFIKFGSNQNAGVTNCNVKSPIAINLGGDISNIIIDNVAIDSTEIGLLLFVNTDVSKIILRNIQIKMANQTGEGIHAREAYGNPLKMSNITIENAGIGITSYVGAINLDNVSIYNSQIGLSSGLGLWSNVTAKNCKFEATNNVIGSQGTVSVDNSTIQGLVANGGTSKIGNSKIIGSFSGGNTVKMVNCYNDNYDPIPNGIY